MVTFKVITHERKWKDIKYKKKGKQMNTFKVFQLYENKRRKNETEEIRAKFIRHQTGPEWFGCPCRVYELPQAQTIMTSWNM